MKTRTVALDSICRRHPRQVQKDAFLCCHQQLANKGMFSDDPRESTCVSL